MVGSLIIFDFLCKLLYNKFITDNSLKSLQGAEQKGKKMTIAKISVKNYKKVTTSALCLKCNGQFLKDDRPNPQEAAKKFGIQPNSCLPDEDGTIHCPKLLGII